MISYRAQRFLRRLCVTLLILLIIGAVLLMCWFLWLQRYVVYTEDGAKLDFGISLQFPEGEVATPPEPKPTVSIVYNDDANATTPTHSEFTRFSGYYVTLGDIQADAESVRTQLEALPKGTAVLLDVKNIKGEFYYSSALGTRISETVVAEMDSIISLLNKKGHYLIARLPAFRERQYFMADTENWSRNPHGLAKKNGNGSLWEDDQQCYWLDPTSEGALSYLIQIVTELKMLGFDEVVFTEFRYPETSSVNLPTDRLKVLNETAATLVRTCATDNFTLSFARNRTDLTLPQGRTRLYLENVSATDAVQVAEQSGYPDPNVQLVFLTTLPDTRFDTYCVLRPLELAR